MSNLQSHDMLILCGGLGKRLRERIGNQQKTMAQIKSEPFLNLLLRYLKGQGFGRFILCTGFEASQVEDYYTKNNLGLDIAFSRETEPLGTGGALKNAQRLIKSDTFFALNGDSFCDLAYQDLFAFHQAKQALATLVVMEDERQDVGKIELKPDGQICSFLEKEAASQKKDCRLMNAGIYCFQRKIFSHFPDKKPCSLEYDVFSKLIGQRLYGHVIKEKLLDIGTPERYEQAQKILGKGHLL